MHNYRRALWPEPNETVGEPIPLETLDPKIMEEAVTAIRHVLREHLVPEDLAQRFTAQRVRVHPGSPYVIDMLMARYEVGEWRVQILEGAHRIKILLYPLRRRPVASPEEYVLSVAREVLKIPEELADQVFPSRMAPPSPAPGDRKLNSRSVGSGKEVWYGNLRCKAREPFIGSFDPNRPKDTWVTQIGTMTDGRTVFFSIRETHRNPGRPQARPGPVARFPVATTSQQAHPTRRPIHIQVREGTKSLNEYIRKKREAGE